jgi:mitochondrial import inner membrane translocase subunit TIM44
VPKNVLLQRSQSRAFHSGPQLWQQAQTQPEEKEPKKSPEDVAEDAAEAKPGPKADDEAKADEATEGEADRKESEQDGEQAKEKKKDLPPPPPHGDKTPWQVFMETMQSELKQSKEWNESTKALADGAHQFTESESVQRARKAYEATSGAVSSTAGKVLKSTASAVGKGAAWTWETPVMKGVRKGANATGEALDKATKPIRETEAYKNVKDVIDDGSSSRYGGWVEKEERKKRRELREKLDQHKAGKTEVMQEDPE